MSSSNAKVRKIYEKFKIEGEYESEDDREWYLSILYIFYSAFTPKVVLFMIRYRMMVTSSLISDNDSSIGEDSFSKNSSFLMSGNNWIDYIVWFGSLCLRNLMRSSFYGDEDNSWVNLLEAWMLFISKPRIPKWVNFYIV